MSFKLEVKLKLDIYFGLYIPHAEYEETHVPRPHGVIERFDNGTFIQIKYTEKTNETDSGRMYKKYITDNNLDGAIPDYRGFHPHTLWSNYYAYVPERKMRAIDIREKKPFTESPKEEFASSGTYYFKDASLMLNYFRRCVS